MTAAPAAIIGLIVALVCVAWMERDRRPPARPPRRCVHLARPLGVGPDACDVWACPACAYRVSFEQALTGALLVDPGRGRAAYRYRRGLLFPVARHIVARGPRGVTHILDSRCVRLADDNEGEASQNDAGATSLSDLWREELRGLLGE